jgi:putative membrane protein
MKQKILMRSNVLSFDAQTNAAPPRHAPGTTAGSSGSWRIPSLLLVVFAALWLALAIAPVSRADWLLENLLVVIVVPWLIATAKRMRFSNAAYLCLFVFFVAHGVGAHFTYSLVPYDRWLQDLTGSGLSALLGLERNHYDRLVHFLYGALLLLPTVELFARYGAMADYPWNSPTGGAFVGL